jgi:guanidinoacetate N-methyltransferase
MERQPAGEEQRHWDELRRAYAGLGAYDREAWRTAPAVLDGHTLKILGHPIMEDWERPYMARLADVATRKGGQVLEVGFGMGISAGYVNASPKVTRHVIVEANHDVAELARGFAADRDRRCPVEVLEGLWEEVVDQVEDGSCGGVLFDAYPLDEAELTSWSARFARTAYRKLEPGGFYTYYSAEVSGYGPEHLRGLVEAGFSERNISCEVVPVSPPADCLYWKHDSIMAPVVVK